MGKLINIETRESPGASVTYVQKPAQRIWGPDGWEPGYTESTGCRTVTVYTGLYDELAAMAGALHGSAGQGGSSQITWEATQTEGPMGELRITTETFRRPASDDDDSDAGGGGDAGGGEPGDSPDNPEVSIQSNTVEEPLLTHPKFRGVGGDTLTALKAMIDGASEGDTVRCADGMERRIAALVKGCEAAEYIKRGVTSYLCPHTVVTLRSKGRHAAGSAGQIGSAAGLPPAAGSRNWLCTGTGVEMSGGEAYSTSTWELSGPGGWDKGLYS